MDPVEEAELSTHFLVRYAQRLGPHAGAYVHLDLCGKKEACAGCANIWRRLEAEIEAAGAAEFRRLAGAHFRRACAEGKVRHDATDTRHVTLGPATFIVDGITSPGVVTVTVRGQGRPGRRIPWYVYQAMKGPAAEDAA
jgi:hypothetical protein